MRRRIRSLPAVLLLPLACGPDEGGAAFEPVVDVKQLMLTVVEPAAEVYWDAVGWVIDAEGTHETVPRTADEWSAVLNAAVLVAESGNLMMMQGRAPGDADWTTFSRALIAVGREAMAAAEDRDPLAVFEVGGRIYETCTACHAAYALETLRPSDTRR
jgi:hypothetical protein